MVQNQVHLTNLLFIAIRFYLSKMPKQCCGLTTAHQSPDFKSYNCNSMLLLRIAGVRFYDKQIFVATNSYYYNTNCVEEQ